MRKRTRPVASASAPAVFFQPEKKSSTTVAAATDGGAGRQRPFFVVAKNASPCIKEYSESAFCKSARFTGTAYQYVNNLGTWVTTGGLLNALRDAFYPDYEENRSKRKRATNVRGSTSEWGIDTDTCIMSLVQGAPLSSVGAMARALHVYLVGELGHVYEAAQLPVRVLGNKMTQVDLVTRDFFGRLHVWEVKTGMPVGGFRQQGMLAEPYSEVKCTKYNIWQLQLCHTRDALEAELNLTVHEAHVIQLYMTKETGQKVHVKVHDQAEWTKKRKPGT